MRAPTPVILSVDVPRAPSSRIATRVSAPLRLASYAKDAHGRLHFPGTEYLRTFHKPVPPQDLTEGLESFVDKNDESGTSIDPILQALSSVDMKITQDIHFVSYRNNLNKIMETPYNTQDPWRIHLRRSQGTVYMDVVKLPERSTQSDADRKRFTYWGYKFEQLCTQQPNTKQQVNANEEFCSVFKMSIGSSRIILAAEMDCALLQVVDKAGEKRRAEKLEIYSQLASDTEYVELKTSRQIEHPRQQETFQRFKLLKFWIQSFLGGVPHICCGFRDDYGQILDLQMLRTLEIPRMVRGKKNMWDPATCLEFTETLLDSLRGATQESKCYQLNYCAPFKCVTLHEIDENET